MRTGRVKVTWWRSAEKPRYGTWASGPVAAAKHVCELPVFVLRFCVPDLHGNAKLLNLHMRGPIGIDENITIVVRLWGKGGCGREGLNVYQATLSLW